MLEQLIAAQRAAHNAWMACPEKTKKDKAAKAELAEVLANCARAVAEEKRRMAAATISATEVSVAIDAAIQRQQGRQDHAELLASVKSAGGMYRRAMDYPRCGQGWPNGPAEKAANALLEDHGYLLGEGWEE